MFRLSALCLVSLALLPTVRAAAGEFNRTLNLGDAGPAWTNLPGVDGKPHGLAEFQGKSLVVVIFTCNSCPIANDYEERLIALAEKHGDQVGFVAINVNKIEADSLPEMKKRAEEKGYPFPYLFDETQKIARDYGAIYTPEVFLLDKDRKVIYMGGVDDNSVARMAKSHYLAAAIDAARAGKPIAVKETAARGCLIRFTRERKK